MAARALLFASCILYAISSINAIQCYNCQASKLNKDDPCHSPMDHKSVGYEFCHGDAHGYMCLVLEDENRIKRQCYPRHDAVDTCEKFSHLYPGCKVCYEDLCNGAVSTSLPHALAVVLIALGFSQIIHF